MSPLYSVKRRRTVNFQTCFICLNSFKSGGERCQQEICEQIYARFIQVLKRYLQISIEDDGDKFGKGFTDKWVGGGEVPVFCDCCLNTVTQVCDLYHELCTIRVRLGSKLGELGTLIERGNGRGVCDDRTKHLRIAKSVVFKNKSIGEFRQLVASKCLQKFKDAGPQVSINSVTPTVTPSLVLGQDVIVKVETPAIDMIPSDEETEWEVDHNPSHLDSEPEPDVEDSKMEFRDEELGDNLSNDDFERINKEGSSIRKSDDVKKSRCRKMKTKPKEKSCVPEGQNLKTRRRKKTSRVQESDDKKSLPCSHCDQLFSSTSHLQSHLNDIEAKIEDKPLQCVFCWKSFALEQSHKLHLKMNHSNNLFICHEPSCRASFEKLQQLNEHLLDHSSSQELSFCSKCNWGFLSSANLTLHELTHTPKAKGVYNCSKCDKVFAKMGGYQDHYNSKHGDNLPFHKCSKCNLSFASSHRLVRHLKSHDETTKMNMDVKIDLVDAPANPLRCNECHKTFVDESRLRFHSWYHSTKKCSTCQEKFKAFEEYSKHMKVVHCEEILEPCHICQKTMKSRPALIKHLRIMHGPQSKDHLCPYCGRGYRDSLYLRGHMARSHPEECHDGAKHSCPHCKQKFRRNLTLKRHLDLCDKNPDRKTDAGPPTIVKQICSGTENTCATCFKVIKFGTVGMRRHLITHIPKAMRQKVTCRICGMKLVSKSSLWSHLRKTHDEKNTLCQDCGAMYFSSDGGRHRCSQQPKRDKNGYHHFNKEHQLIEGVSQVCTTREGRNFHLEVMGGKKETSE